MPRLLDDFATDPLAAPARWTCFTDRVMGGQSDGRVTWEVVQGRPALRLRGHVSLANRGGFIQAAASLGGDRPFDASEAAGFALDVCGTAGRYFLHARTDETRSPWQHYSAAVRVGPTWETVRLRWEDFTASAVRAPLDPHRLVRVGLVAGWAEFDADVSLARLALWP